MAVNKVVYDGKTLIDLTEDTVTAGKLAKGITAHDKGGNPIEGTMVSSSITEVEALPTSSIGADAIYATTERRDVDVFVGDYEVLFPLKALGEVYLVDALPSSPKVSDISDEAVQGQLYTYVFNDKAYIYTNAGNGNEWILASAIFGIPDKGYIEHESFIVDEGVYVTYNKKDVIAVSNTNNDKAIYQYNGVDKEWKNYYHIFLSMIGGNGYGEIDIPYGIGTIRPYAFAYQLITAVNIPNSVKIIRDGAFLECTALTSVTIPDSVTSIGEDTFHECSSLTSVTIPNSVTEIGSGAFQYCFSLTSIAIPDGVTIIGENTFHNCTGLTSVVIGDSVTSIGKRAFSYCTNLTSVVIPDSVTSIGESAFHSCTNLTSVVIGDSVTSIGTSAFYNCTGLTSVVIPDSVTSIGSHAFSYCTNLTSVVIPDSVTSIDWYVFRHCTSLTSVTYGGTKAQWNAITYGNQWDDNTGEYTVHCTDGDIAKS